MQPNQTHLFRELKAKKAKFGFESSLGTYNFMALSALLQVALRGAVPNVDFKLDSNSYGSHTDIKIYTDHATWRNAFVCWMPYRYQTWCSC